ncbi:hypothetical protein BACCAP_01583 [Pseudoflavonifractor capillosus ATCC 29799]|uniref:Uncharacterized protein n=1 Tax=Pseudoflavonifractor capillosus ATCC 29799 TaxID=411467 RepID=A6NTQ4_9FIRM|nr:hypothetical protein BACCAP_01583 [Pseudoflavonifractor capillosus ATCC 29799]
MGAINFSPREGSGLYRQKRTTRIQFFGDAIQPVCFIITQFLPYYKGKRAYSTKY